MKKHIFLFYITISSILLFLIIDLVLSSTLYKQSHCFNYKYFNSGYYYDLFKNCSSKYRFKSGFPVVDLFTDKNGLRVASKKERKDKNNKNIFIFGDSFTFGVGLDYQNTYAGIIDKKLEDYNVYNYAVGSYSPTVHLYRLKQALKKNIYPEKIILFLDLTDVIDESNRWVDDKNIGHPIRPETKKINTKILYDNFNFTHQFINLTRFYIRVLKNKLNYSISKKINVKTSIQGQFTYTAKNQLHKEFWQPQVFEKGLAKIEFNINKIAQISQKIKSDFYVVIYPWAETLEFGEDEFSWTKYSKNLCKYNCNLINSIPDFIKYKKNNKNWPSKLYFVGDEHFNKEGARLLADVVLREIGN